jgi:hypothetical protein
MAAFLDNEAECSEPNNDDSEPVHDSQVASLIDDTPLSEENGENHAALLNRQRLEDDNDSEMGDVQDRAPLYLPPTLTPKLTLCFESFCDFNSLEQDGERALTLFWSFYGANSEPWPELGLVYTPPEMDGLTLAEGLHYMAGSFPYPALEFVLPKLMFLADLFVGPNYSQNSYVVGYTFGQPNVTERSVSNCYIIIIKSLRDVVLRCQYFKGLFEDITRRFTCFYVAEDEGNLSVVMFSYAPVRAPLAEGCRILRVKDTSNCLEIIRHSTIQVGEWDEHLVVSEPSLARWRECFLNYGILCQDDLKRCLAHGVNLKQLHTLNKQLGNSKVKCKPIYEDGFTFVFYKMGKVSSLVILLSLRFVFVIVLFFLGIAHCRHFVYESGVGSYERVSVE